MALGTDSNNPVHKCFSFSHQTLHQGMCEQADSCKVPQPVNCLHLGALKTLLHTCSKVLLQGKLVRNPLICN